MTDLENNISSIIIEDINNILNENNNDSSKLNNTLNENNNDSSKLNNTLNENNNDSSKLNNTLNENNNSEFDDIYKNNKDIIKLNNILNESNNINKLNNILNENNNSEFGDIYKNNKDIIKLIDELKYYKDNEYDNENKKIINISPIKSNKLSYKTVENIIKSYFQNEEIKESCVLDVIVLYLKGQKILYTEAKTYCETQLNYLMLPAIFISAVCTVLTLAIKDYRYSSIIISSLNGLNSFILTLITYLKLDAKAEAHKTSAYKFEKLQSYVEFNSGKMLFESWLEDDDSPEILIAKIINEVENKVQEIKETNQFILPEFIRYSYNTIYSTNVFSKIKQIQNDEAILINNLKEIINDKININDILKFNENDQNNKNFNPNHLNDKLIKLNIKQNEILNKIIKHKFSYQKIDDEFNEEIIKQIDNRKKKFIIFNCCFKYGLL